jgi:hypothetical protein
MFSYKYKLDSKLLEYVAVEKSRGNIEKKFIHLNKNNFKKRASDIIFKNVPCSLFWFYCVELDEFYSYIYRIRSETVRLGCYISATYVPQICQKKQHEKARI